MTLHQQSSSLNNTMSSTSEPPPYIPSSLLLAGSGLSQDELVTQYQEFRRTLQHAQTAPELVFERLIGNMMAILSATLSRERADHAVAQEAWHLEKATLQSDLDHATASARKTEIVRVPSPALDFATIPAPGRQTYLQFLSLSANHVCGTAINTPYWTAAGFTKIDHITSSGSYDSRMDALITTPTIPTTLTHVVRFLTPYETPPQVLVWLTGLSGATGSEVNVATAAKQITETGFELQISSHDGAPVQSVGAAWAVFESLGEGEPHTVKVDSYSNKWHGRPRAVTLESTSTLGHHGSVHRVGFAALCAVDLALEAGIWVEVRMDMEREKGAVAPYPTVKIKAGPADRRVYSVGVGYYVL